MSSDLKDEIPEAGKKTEWTAYHTLIKKVVDKCIPWSAILELTYRCNFRCVQCYILQERASDELSTEEVKDLCGQLAKAGTLYLILTGGEPFVRKDLFDILDHAKKLHFAVTIQTNGSLLTESVVDRLAQYKNLMGLAVSFYAGSRELFEKIVQVPGSYDRVFRGVQYAVSKKIRVRLKTPIISSNLCTLDKMKEFAKELNLVYRYTPIITPKDDGSKENLENRLTDEELKSFLRGEKMENLYRDPVDIRAPVCTAARSQVAVSPTGEVYPCIQIRKSAGNIRNKPFSELWKSDIFKPYRTLTMADIEKCSVCDLQGYCSPCMGLAEIEHGSITIPPSEYCRLAAIKKEIYNEKKNKKSS